MNKKFILPIVYCYCIFSASFVQAQFFNVDAPETISDSSNLIGKVTDHVKEAQKHIENSQLGKAIGDGVKQAKKGMDYAKGVQEEMNAAYNQGMKYKDEKINSPEYKIAKKSAEIALLNAKIKELEKQQKQDQQETEDKISLVQAEADAKIKNLNKNLANTQILMADGDNEQARVMAKSINNEIAQIKRSTADKVSALQDELLQKTGLSQPKNSTEEVEEKNNQNAAEVMDWEISDQNQDNLIATLKPGNQITDTLQDSLKTPQDLSQTQTSNETTAVKRIGE